MVTALGDFEVGVVARGRKHTVRRVKQLEIGGFQQLRQFREGEETIHLRQSLLQFRHIALHEASHHVQLLDLAPFLAFDLLQDFIHGLLPRVVDETACVDDDDVGLLRTLVIKLVPVAVQLRGHDFRIDDVLGTSQGDDVDGHKAQISVGKDTKKAAANGCG